MYDDENAAQTALEQAARTSFQSTRFSRPDLESRPAPFFTIPTQPDD